MPPSFYIFSVWEWKIVLKLQEASKNVQWRQTIPPSNIQIGFGQMSNGMFVWDMDTFPDSVNVQLLLFSLMETEDVIVW